MQILKFTAEDTEFFQTALNIRTEVFVHEQNVPKSLEYDGNDSTCTHYLLFDDNIPVGTARRRFTENGLKLERLAIVKSQRGKGFAHELMQFIMKDILPFEKKIYLHAQEGVEKIYEKYGFKIVGEQFVEAGIKHFKMEFEYQK